VGKEQTEKKRALDREGPKGRNGRGGFALKMGKGTFTATTKPLRRRFLWQEEGRTPIEKKGEKPREARVPSLG